MRHLKAINRKARSIAALHDAQDAPDVVALQGAAGPHIPLGCSFVFSPGWEVDSSGGTAGRDFPDEAVPGCPCS